MYHLRVWNTLISGMSHFIELTEEPTDKKTRNIMNSVCNCCVPAIGIALSEREERYRGGCTPAWFQEKYMSGMRCCYYL